MEIYQIRITLLHTRPPIWRRVLLPRDMMLRRLHWTVQIVMGWTDSHLHRFALGREKYSDRRSGHSTGLGDENRTKLGDVLRAPGNRLLYEYDFGDCWQHMLLLEKVLPGDESFQAMCVAGERNCPPEDCGGAHGFAELLEIRRNPNHPQHNDLVEWVGEEFDPEHFDLENVNRRLRRRKR